MAEETTRIITEFSRKIVRAHYMSLTHDMRKFKSSVEKGAYPTYARISVEKLLNLYLKNIDNGVAEEARVFSEKIAQVGHIHTIDAYCYAATMVLSVLNNVPVADAIDSTQEDAKKRLADYSEAIFAELAGNFHELVVKCTTYHEPFGSEDLILAFDLVRAENPKGS